MRRASVPGRSLAAAALAAALTVTRAFPAPGELLPVGDPLESELRALETLGPGELRGRLLLPHPGIRPLQLGEILGSAPSPDTLDPARAITRARLERALSRQAGGAFAPESRWPSTPWAFRRADTAGTVTEFSAGLEGRGVAGPGGSSFVSGSGLQMRAGVAMDRWLAWSHVLIGQVDQARAFADPIAPNNDVIVWTEDTYLAYTAGSGRWSGWFGRSRWHWGPGEEGSLTLSKTSPAVTGLAYRVHVAPLHLDATALSASLDVAAGHQLAAHRVEWAPRDGLHLGLTETASYRGTGWHPLYVVGAIPYILVQRMEWQDSPDSLRALRNNIMVAVDGAWRVRPGTRLYGELLIDDLHARTANIPNKWGWQAGWDGAGVIGATRVTWNGEYTRLSRYVYTSFFGQTYAAHGQPIGFPTGPDSRRLHLRVDWALDENWQLGTRVTRTDKGENDLGEPFVPGSGPPPRDVMRFEGVVERTREVEAGARWWPASGVDLAVWAGWRWVDNERHVAGRTASGATAAAEVRLTR